MIKECLACEKSFNPMDSTAHGTSERFVNQYCSKICEDHFEQYLKESGVPADSPLSAPKSAPVSDINKLIAHFSTRIKDKK